MLPQQQQQQHVPQQQQPVRQQLDRQQLLHLTQIATAAGWSFTELSGEQRQAVCTTLGIGLDLLQQFFEEEAGPAAAAAAGGAVGAAVGVAPRGVKRGLDRA
jgi:phosphate/sulfate permease